MKTEKTLSVAERKAALELELEKLDLIDSVNGIIDDYIKSAQEDIEYYLNPSVEIGHEEEQAVSGTGELLYSKGWRTIPQSEFDALSDEDKAKCEPYHKPIYEKQARTLDELRDWERKRVLSKQMLIEKLVTIKE